MKERDGVDDFVTYHDATVGGHKRILVAHWLDSGHVDGRFGPELDPDGLPDGFCDWKRYDMGSHTDCWFEVLSKTEIEPSPGAWMWK